MRAYKIDNDTISYAVNAIKDKYLEDLLMDYKDDKQISNINFLLDTFSDNV